MHDEYKTLLIENESEFKSDLLKEIENIDELDELLEYLDRLISIQYYKGLFYESNEYDEILSKNINRIIENYYESKYDENKSYYTNLENLKLCYDSDESKYKYYLKSLLNAYDLFISGITFKTEIYDSIEILSIYLIDLYSENDYIEMPKYLDEIIIYESENDYYSAIDEIIANELNHESFNFKTKCYESFIHSYFNYESFKKDELDSDELIEYSGLLLESNNFIEYAYIKDYNKLC